MCIIDESYFNNNHRYSNYNILIAVCLSSILEKKKNIRKIVDLMVEWGEYVKLLTPQFLTFEYFWPSFSIHRAFIISNVSHLKGLK